MPGADKSNSLRVDRREFLSTLAALSGGAIAAAITPSVLGQVETTQPAADSATQPVGNHNPTNYLDTANGWYIHNGKAVWGYAQHNRWWGGYRGEPHGWYSDEGLSPSLICNDPSGVGLNKTEDLDKLTDSMLQWGYPGFEHTPPLWYDRRRDTHSRVPQTNGNVVAPFLEMPWRDPTKARPTMGCQNMI